MFSFTELTASIYVLALLGLSHKVVKQKNLFRIPNICQLCIYHLVVAKTKF